MVIRSFLHPIMIIMLLILIGCSPSSSTFSLNFTGDGEKLLIQESELPSGWKLKQLRNNFVPNANDWTAIYEPVATDPFGTWGEIVHGVTVFDREEDAVVFFDEMYRSQKELFSEIAETEGSSVDDFVPPKKYSYKSPVAHQFRVDYLDETGSVGRAVGYRYTVWARYGNVISVLEFVVEDEEMTGIKAGEANVLPWSEGKRLLKLVDEKFTQASLSTE